MKRNFSLGLAVVFLLVAILFSGNFLFKQLANSNLLKSSDSVGAVGEVLAASTIYHVSPSGSDSNPGTSAQPFKTIQHAADVAEPGNTVIVHAGTYREWVKPPRGGTSDSLRIIYKAAPGERAIIKGSEEINNWVREGTSQVWKATIPNALFGDYNPYKLTIGSGEPGVNDWLSTGQNYHRGQVYLDGVPYTEKLSRSGIDGTPGTWFVPLPANQPATQTEIYANFGTADPNSRLAEINVRNMVFAPTATQVNYITVDGFEMVHGAPFWTGPGGNQQGLVSTHWSSDWVIQNNLISDSKATCVMSGRVLNPPASQNVITGWGMNESSHHLGFHTIQNNIIRRCGQAGIAGSVGLINSDIKENLIEDINFQRLYGGAETGGIKIHNAIDVRITKNIIRRIGPTGSGNGYTGIWLDWSAQGTRISGNIIYDIEGNVLWLEKNHGPTLIDNNVLIGIAGNVTSGSLNTFKLGSSNSIFVHNLLVDPSFNFYPASTPQGDPSIWVPHTSILASGADIVLQEDFFSNNIFINKGSNSIPRERGYRLDYNVFYSGAQKSNWGDTNSIVQSSFDPNFNLQTLSNGVKITFQADSAPRDVGAPLITRALVGENSRTNQGIEEHDGSAITINRDINGTARSTTNPTAGSLENLAIGPNQIQLLINRDNQGGGGSDPISVSISASPASMTLPNNRTTLTWTTTGNPTFCTASNYWSGSKNPNGGTEERTGMTAGTYVFNITCSKASSPDATDSVRVVVNPTGSGSSSVALPNMAKISEVNNMIPYTHNNANCTVTLRQGDNFQTALNDAEAGDTICLTAGATFAGRFTLPVKSNSQQRWINIVSTRANELPNGRRVLPTDQSKLAIIKNDSSSGMALTFAQGASYYRLVGLEVTTDQNPTGAIIVSLGVSNNTNRPHHIVIDRSYIHGQVNNQVRRCIALSGDYIGIANSTISEAHQNGNGDTQGISITDAVGGILIQNNMLEGGENIIIGGSTTLSIPADIVFRGNHFWKNPSRRNDPNYDMKNNFELKHGRRILVEGNIFENHWAGVENQHYAIVFKSSNQGGSQAQTEDITFRYNKVINIDNFLGVLRFAASRNATEGTRDINVHNNLVIGLGHYPSRQDSSGVPIVLAPSFSCASDDGVECLAARNVNFDHNTIVAPEGNNGAYTLYHGGQILNNGLPIVVPEFTYTNNVVGTKFSADLATFTRMFPDMVFAGNVVVGQNLFPNGNKTVSSYSGLLNNDYSLAINYNGTDGRPAGANIPLVEDCTQGADNGTWNGCNAGGGGSYISVSISASPTFMTLPNNRTTLTWTTTGNPTSCTASNYWSGSKTPSGGTEERTGMTADTYDFNITCSKAGSPDASDSVRVVVNPAGNDPRNNCSPLCTEPEVCMFIGARWQCVMGANCTTDADCASGFVCRNNRCAYPGGGGGGTDTTPPTISITSPTNNSTVSGTVNIVATASDNVGVSKVEFYVDEVLKSTDTSVPYSYSWDSELVSNGFHTIKAKAFDAAGNNAIKNVNVTASNAGGGGGGGGGGGPVGCVNPPSVPATYATPCPVLELSVYDASGGGPLSVKINPDRDYTDFYIYKMIYVSELTDPCPNGESKVAGVWCPFTLAGTFVPGDSNYLLNGSYTLPSSMISKFSSGDHYLVSWDWRWNGSCFLGPDSSACNTGKWRLQRFVK